MILQAFAFYTFHSWKNAIVARLRRLRQPKYLVGAIVGVLYFYFVVFARYRARSHGVPMWNSSPESLQLMHTIGTAVFFVLFLLAWIFPRERAALVFTEAEIAFLFPAPIGRRTLINFKLLRTQLVILISAIMITIFGRAWGGTNPFIRVIGWWIVLATMSLHSLGASFVVTSLTERGLTTWKRRLVVVAIIVAAIGTIGFYIAQTAPPPPWTTGSFDMSVLQKYFLELCSTGPIYYVLTPFRVLLAPFFSRSWPAFFSALLPALAILIAHYWWVISANVAFEEASIELSRKTAEKVAAMRAGQWGVKKPTKAKRSPFELQPGGSPAIALLWKNLISSGQIFSRRFWMVIVWMVIVTAMVSRGHAGWSITLTMFAAMFLIMSLFFGPQMLRLDFRQDLPMADVLKILPMRGWQVVLGEILAPVVLLAAFQWLLVVVLLLASPSELGRQNFPFALKLSYCLAASVLLPFLNFIAILLQNAAVLFLPAWFQFDKTAPRGIETMGQQLILIFGQILALAVCLAPAVIAFSLVFFASHFILPFSAGLVLGSIGAAAMMFAEVAIAVRLLGGVFERFDLSAELTER